MDHRQPRTETDKWIQQSTPNLSTPVEIPIRYKPYVFFHQKPTGVSWHASETTESDTLHRACAQIARGVTSQSALNLPSITRQHRSREHPNVQKRRIQKYIKNLHTLIKTLHEPTHNHKIPKQKSKQIYMNRTKTTKPKNPDNGRPSPGNTSTHMSFSIKSPVDITKLYKKHIQHKSYVQSIESY